MKPYITKVNEERMLVTFLYEHDDLPPDDRTFESIHQLAAEEFRLWLREHDIDEDDLPDYNAYFTMDAAYSCTSFTFSYEPIH